MDEWFAVWFWPTVEESLRHAPTPLTFHTAVRLQEGRPGGVSGTGREVLSLGDGVPGCFHARTQRFRWHGREPALGRDGAEFPGILYGVRPALPHLSRRKPPYGSRKNCLQTVPGVSPTNGTNTRAGSRLSVIGPRMSPNRSTRRCHEAGMVRGWRPTVGEASVGKHICYVDAKHPFRLQGSADLNSYKLFAEFFWSLLKPNGRLGRHSAHGHLFRSFGTKTCGRNCSSLGGDSGFSIRLSE